PASAIADTTKTSPCGASEKRRIAVRTVAPIATTSRTRVVRPRSAAIDGELAEGAVTLPMIRALPSGHAHQPARGRDEPISPPARSQPSRLVSVGLPGAGPGAD